jgi:Ni/Co efflux regulator RcnB
MKKILIALLAFAFVSISFAETASPAPKKADTKKEAPAKKEVKKHKKFEGEKVPDAPAKAPAKKK